MKCVNCFSYAINNSIHGRDGSDLNLCDVCYWRKRANPPVAPAPEIREAMTWTKDLPTEPGWYWTRKPLSRFAKVKKISMYDSGLVLDEAEAVYDLRYYPNYDWYGPIPQPQDPKAEGGKV